MISTALGIALAAKAVVHSGMVKRDVKPLSIPMVEVRDCETHALIKVYADRRFTEPMTNPLFLDGTGFYMYYTESPFVLEKITYGSESIIISTCPVPESE